MTRIALHAAPVNLQNATFLGGGRREEGRGREEGGGRREEGGGRREEKGGRREGGGGRGGEKSTVSVGQHELVKTPSVKQSVNKLVITSLHVWVLIIHAFLAISTTFAYWYTCPLVRMMPSSIVRQHTVSQSSSGTVYVQCQPRPGGKLRNTWLRMRMA